MELMIDLAVEQDFEKKEAAYFRRSGAGWMAQPEPVTITLPSDVYAELKQRSDHDGLPLPERITWLLTELVRRQRRGQL